MRRLRRYRVLFGCLVLSLAFHFLVVPLLVRLFGTPRGTDRSVEVVYQMHASSLELTHRAAPRPKALPLPHALPRTRAVVQPRPVHVAQAHPREVSRRERLAIRPPLLARTTYRKHAGPSQETIDVAQQQAAFEKTIARLREQDNPVAGAQRPVQVAAAEPERFAFDVSKSVGSSPQAQGVLTPVRTWHDGPYDYYYVQYWVEYEDGTTETGYVPWPIRYLPKDDPFLLHREHFPLPGPLADFTLPRNTNVHPLIAFCLEHRDELSTCPIEHD